MTVDKFWTLLRDFADSAEAIPRPTLYTRIEATSSTPSITELDGNYYALQFEDGAYSVNIIDGNTNIRDVEVKNSVSVNTNNTTGFIDPTYLQHSTFGGGVHVDVLNGTVGTDYPIGTPGTPVNNIEDAQTIAAVNGFFVIFVMGNITLSSTAFLSNFKIIGQNAQLTTITVDSLAVVNTTEFLECTLTGDLDGGSVLRSGVAYNLNYINGFLFEVMISGNLTLGGGAAAHLFNCFSGTPGTATPIIDMSGSGQALALRGYNGGVTIINKSGSDSVSLDMASGTVFLDSTVTNGDIVVRGVAQLIDNSTGTANVLTDGLVQTGPINATIDVADIFNEDLTPYTTAGSFGQWLNQKGLTVQKYFGIK